MNKEPKQPLSPNPENLFESQPFRDLGFVAEITRDGSPTLRLNPLDSETSGELTESMHHSGGAASETWYIYGSVIQKALRTNKPLNIACIGLGMGFIESAWALSALAEDQTNLAEMDSFEVVPGLVQNFVAWIQRQATAAESIYNLAAETLIRTGPSVIRSLTAKDIQIFLANQKQRQRFRIHDNVMTYQGAKRWNLICFDAFSKKTEASIWDESFLQKFIEQHCDKDCIFTTYACTSNLKKILVKNGFTWIDRAGFSGKRDSTLAVRGFFNSESVFQTFSHNQ